MAIEVADPDAEDPISHDAAGPGITESIGGAGLAGQAGGGTGFFAAQGFQGEPAGGGGKFVMLRMGEFRIQPSQFFQAHFRGTDGQGESLALVREVDS